MPELIGAGITSFKIEGRVKSAYYTAVVTNTYRMAIDAYRADERQYRVDPAWLGELDSVSHREYSTGFFFTPPHEQTSANTVAAPGYIREKAYLATALTDSDSDGRARFIQRNKLFAGRAAELLTPGRPGIPFVAEDVRDEAGEPIESTPHPAMIFSMRASVRFGPRYRGAGGGLILERLSNSRRLLGSCRRHRMAPDSSTGHMISLTS